MNNIYLNGCGGNMTKMISCLELSKARQAIEKSEVELKAKNSIEKYQFSVVLEHDIASLKRYKPSLERLVADATETKDFYEPCMLFPALESYAPKHRMIYLLIKATNLENGRYYLCGFIPMEIRSIYKGLPLQHIALWTYPHCYLSTPLLHRRFFEQSLKALIWWFQMDRRYQLMIVNQISASDNFHHALQQVLAAKSVKH